MIKRKSIAVRTQGRKTQRYLQLPSGMRDLLPEEAGRFAALQLRLRQSFAQWGYREVATPTLEYLETIVRGAGEGIGDRLFKLVGMEGELLALRPEMTVPIARVVATRLGDEVLPLRLCYISSIFRGREARGDRMREFTQAGAELVGAPGVEADAEVIALAVECLEKAGLKEFQIGIGHVGFLKGLLAEGVQEEDREAVRDLLYRQDFVGLREGLQELGVDQGVTEAILRLPSLRGARALDEALRLCTTEQTKVALEELHRLLDALRAYCPEARIYLDLGIIRDFDYYTGVVFEGYAGSLGYPLLGGGRYDSLLVRFGRPLPATGFAMDVDRVLAAGVPTAPTPRMVAVVLHGSNREKGLTFVRRLRDRGIGVIVEVLGRSWPESCEAAKNQGVPFALLVGGDEAKVRDLRTGEEWVGSLEEAEAFLIER